MENKSTAELCALVQNKLQDSDKCTNCVAVCRMELGSKTPCLLALVEAQGEHGLFTYLYGRALPAALNLDKTLAVSSDFKFSIVTPSGPPQNGADSVEVKFFTEQSHMIVELPRNSQAAAFFNSLKTAVQVQTQTAGFGVPSTFSWMEKYASSSDSDDMFDPFARPKATGWPHTQLVSTTVGQDCPVVKDPMDRSPSLQSVESKDLTDGSTMSKSQSTDSMDRSLDELGNSVRSGKPPASRENLIRLIMQQKEDQFVEVKNYRVFCGTWNTNGQLATEVLDDWLQPDSEPPDIYAIGFQELDLSKNAFIFSESPKEQEWYNRVKAGLHKKATYKRVKLIRLVGMMLIIFVRKEIVPLVNNVMAETAGTGIMGMMGNKGGVGVRFSLHDSNICFVNSHLAAHIEEYERRNQDFRDINSKMNFGNRSPPLSINNHDLVFWIGDLNYRLSDIDNDKCKEYIEKGRIGQIMSHDQLCRQRALKKVFLDYMEGEINFIPTYKYDPGSDNWDTSEKCRTPAWCDRILWRGPNVNQLRYCSHMTQRVSDHKPVSSLFIVGMKVVNQRKYRHVYQDVMKQLDRLENEFLPQVVLSTTELRFDKVRFVEAQRQSVTVRNTGQVPVQLTFINKLKDQSFCKPWLVVEPSQVLVLVGEEAEIQFEVYVDKMTAAKLNSGDDKLEDILVMHLEEGRDLFVSVSGKYMPSCFGSSLEALVHMFGPIREVKTDTLIDLEHTSSGTSSPGQDRPLDIPKEIWRLVDHLYKFGMQQESLFQQPGMHMEVLQIRDCLDTGIPTVIPGSVHSTAEVLLMFLESTAEPVIPRNYYDKCLECSAKFVLCKQVLSHIPQTHRNVFKYLCSFLRKLLQYSDSNQLEAKFLAKLFGGLMFRAPSRPEAPDINPAIWRAQNAEEERKKATFMYQFLTNEYDE